MTAITAEAPALEMSEADAALWRERLADSNVNPTTLLATDYLNHFNEVVMLIEMIPDMPDCMEDVSEWRPKTYQQHFADSALSDKELAIEAYDHAPPMLRDHLEFTIGQANRLVEVSTVRITEAIEKENGELIETVTQRASNDLKRLVEFAGAIINGSISAINQSEIDNMFVD